MTEIPKAAGEVCVPLAIYPYNMPGSPTQVLGCLGQSLRASSLHSIICIVSAITAAPEHWQVGGRLTGRMNLGLRSAAPQL